MEAMAQCRDTAFLQEWERNGQVRPGDGRSKKKMTVVPPDVGEEVLQGMQQRQRNAEEGRKAGIAAHKKEAQRQKEEQDRQRKKAEKALAKKNSSGSNLEAAVSSAYGGWG